MPDATTDTAAKPFDLHIDKHAIYTMAETAPKLKLSEYTLRDFAVVQKLIPCVRYTRKGKIFFRGQDLLEWLERCRQPAVGERGRRAAQAAVADATKK